ncbi:hypothetical protein PROFUN_06384 [Planoprotostelium fungivorum]|uniref:Uncharacterized protein n=1 Tax=Planoprotostelium fungivorum TaxID=1890364 RepID=A0A2P6NNR3_9EUKA|nr:hypothetical protein PROFUN_06384 [Planoprotostelium fungivorum]
MDTNQKNQINSAMFTKLIVYLITFVVNTLLGRWIHIETSKEYTVRRQALSRAATEAEEKRTLSVAAYEKMHQEHAQLDKKYQIECGYRMIEAEANRIRVERLEKINNDLHEESTRHTSEILQLREEVSMLKRENAALVSVRADAEVQKTESEHLLKENQLLRETCNALSEKSNQVKFQFETELKSVAATLAQSQRRSLHLSDTTTTTVQTESNTLKEATRGTETESNTAQNLNSKATSTASAENNEETRTETASGDTPASMGSKTVSPASIEIKEEIRNETAIGDTPTYVGSESVSPAFVEDKEETLHEIRLGDIPASVGSNTISPASSENEEETPDETTSGDAATSVKSSVMDVTADVASSQKIELASETPRGEMTSPPLESNFYPDDSLEDKDRPMAAQQPSTEEGQGDTSDSVEFHFFSSARGTNTYRAPDSTDESSEDDSEEVQFIDDTVETADHEPNEDNSATPAIPPDYLLPANDFRRTLRPPEWDPVSWVHHISLMQPYNSEYLHDRMTPIYQFLSVATGDVVGEDRHPSDMDFDHLSMVRTYLHFERENLKEPAKVLHHQIDWIGSVLGAFQRELDSAEDEETTQCLLQLQGSYQEEQMEFLQVWRDAHLWLGAVQELERQM